MLLVLRFVLLRIGLFWARGLACGRQGRLASVHFLGAQLCKNGHGKVSYFCAVYVLILRSCVHKLRSAQIRDTGHFFCPDMGQNVSMNGTQRS